MYKTPADSELSPRLAQVYRLLLSALAEKQAATVLAISRHTFHSHAKEVYQRLRVSGRTELLAAALASAQHVPSSAPVPRLSAAQRLELERLLQSKRLSSRERLRAQTLLMWGRGVPDAEISATFGISVRTIQRIRERLESHGVGPAIRRRPQPPRLARRALDERGRRKLLDLAAGPAPEGHRQWSSALLAESMVQLQYVRSLSRETVRRLRSQRVADAPPNP